MPPHNHDEVLVTGCSSGFGRLIAKQMALSGYRVWASMREPDSRNAGPARDLRQWAATHALPLEVIELDIGSNTSVNAAIRSLPDGGSRIAVVVNNAAITAWGPIEAYDPEQLLALYNTNVFGAWRVNKAVLPQMRARRAGLIIHVTSAVGRVLRSGGLYPASKWAAEGLAESMAHEVRPFGIDVVLLEPGAYPTGWVGRGMVPADQAVIRAYEATTSHAPLVQPGPDYRYPDPQEVADEVLRLTQLPAGTRPLRTVVGHIYTEGVAAYNETYEAMRRGLIEALKRPDQALPWLRDR